MALNNSISNWSFILVIISTLLFLDLFVFNSRKKPFSIRSNIILTLVYISIAILFGIYLLCTTNYSIASQYFICLFVEKLMSIDNMFVIFIIFKHFEIKYTDQHKILFYGIIGAIIMRGLLLYHGIHIIQKLYILNAIVALILIYSGYNLVNKNSHQSNKFLLKIIHFFKKFNKQHHSQNSYFWIKKNGKIFFTNLFFALLTVEISDLIFAIDSVPAALAITNNLYIVYTSNIFAILGMRSLYLCISNLLSSFKHLDYILGITLMIIGAKVIINII